MPIPKDELCKVIYDTIYQDSKPMNELKAGLECAALATALLSHLSQQGYVKSVGSICSKHQEPNADCPQCKIHFPFAIDTDKYCKSAGYVKRSEIVLDEQPYEMKERLWKSFLEARGVETPCKDCSGLGVKTYGSTATWRGGIGGQIMSQGVCDRCWGSGDENKEWTDLRKFFANPQTKL